MITDLIQDFPVKLVASANGLRIILPDPKGNLERERMEPKYAAQYDGLEVKRYENLRLPTSPPKHRN